SVGADLHVNYLTTVEVNQAISIAQTQLSSEIEGVESTLQSDYLTSAEVGQAITVSNQLLKSEIEDEQGNSLGASLQVLGQTVATNEGVFSALWGVKTSVNGLQSSVGLVNDGVDPIFAVKGAKFSIITDQDPTNLTPVFAVSDGKTVINTAIIDEAFIKSLVTDDLLANRVIVGSRFTSPSINYNPSNGARSNNFSIDPNGNMLAKSATLESVTIKDSSGNIVMSSTGAIPSSKITGLGSFATKSSLSFNEVTGKPNFGNLAYLNSIAYDDVTGKPSLGPFAGLSKILSSNVTTYIANGAIGSAQIDQAYINQLFGQNASFYGTVYAQNLEGDVYDAMAKKIDIVYSTSADKSIVSFTVSALPFARNIVISGVQASGQGYSASSTFNVEVSLYRSGSSIALDTQTWNGRGDTISTSILPSFVASLPANTSRTFTVKFDSGSNGTYITGTAICSAFKDGSTIS
ncbi:hypothetical protein, partial [Pseudoalteromonas sp. S554]|uniref:phage tail tip fiber protein n=1 Tax=Pseudoalteromonas sp. S554 TaxID=2066516 RepID=UPI001BB15A4F